MSFLSRIGSLLDRGARAWYRFVTTRKTTLGTVGAIVGSLVVVCCVLSLITAPFTNRTSQVPPTAQASVVALTPTIAPTLLPTATRTPRPTAIPEPTVNPTVVAAEQSYITTARTEALTLADALNQVTVLAQKPTGDAGWMTKWKAQDQRIQAVDTTLRAIHDVPVVYANAHALLLDATSACSASVHGATQAIENVSASQMEAAGQLMQGCKTKAEAATKAFNAVKHR